MSINAQQPPERVAYETLRGTIETRAVVDERLHIENCQPKQLLKVEAGDAGRWLHREEVIATDPELQLEDSTRE
jgi:hypothetical protein